MADVASGQEAPVQPAREVTEHLVIFAVPLPDALPIPHGTTYTTFLPWPIAALDGLPSRPQPDAPEFPHEMSGKQFVSLKFWQVKEPVGQSDAQAMEAVFKVVDKLTPREDHTREPFRGPDSSVHYRTVVEMVTIAAEPPDGKPFMHDGLNQSDPFDRCFIYLQQIFRAYRLSQGVLVPQLTYQRLLPLVMTLTRGLMEYGPATVSGLMMLNQMNVNDVPAPELLTNERHDRMNLFLTLLLQGNPFALFAERSLEARKAAERDGDYGNAIVQCALSVE